MIAPRSCRSWRTFGFCGIKAQLQLPGHLGHRRWQEHIETIPRNHHSACFPCMTSHPEVQVLSWKSPFCGHEERQCSRVETGPICTSCKSMHMANERPVRRQPPGAAAKTHAADDRPSQDAERLSHRRNHPFRPAKPPPRARRVVRFEQGHQGHRALIPGTPPSLRITCIFPRRPAAALAGTAISRRTWDSL